MVGLKSTLRDAGDATGYQGKIECNMSSNKPSAADGTDQVAVMGRDV
jgi:hypothetical protein